MEHKHEGSSDGELSRYEYEPKMIIYVFNSLTTAPENKWCHWNLFKTECHNSFLGHKTTQEGDIVTVNPFVTDIF